jgi:putative transposase
MMASLNQVKVYRKNFYYHIYNRGVEKRLIFLEEADYQRFTGKLAGLLTPLEKHKDQSKNVVLLAYCLMPNHFHLVVKNTKQRGIESFMRSLCTSYSRYFNEKYDRVGPLFQGPYKASMITNTGSLLTKVRYVHRNPLEAGLVTDAEDYPHSNYNNYLMEQPEPWFDFNTVLENFPKRAIGYEHYVRETNE